MMAMLAGMCGFMLAACRHVQVRENWHSDEVEAEAFLLELRAVTA